MEMLNILYELFFLLLIFFTIFLAIIMLLPQALQKPIVRLFMHNKILFNGLKVNAVFCVLLLLFYIDLSVTEVEYNQQKADLQKKGYLASQLRRGWLSYSTLKIQRNEYIVFMLIFISITLMAYIKIRSTYYDLLQTKKIKEQKHLHPQFHDKQQEKQQN